MDLLETADRLFTGELDITEHHPFSPSGELAEVAPRTAFVSAFANSAVFATDAGLVMIDTSSELFCKHVHESVRGWSTDRLDTAVFTHGHVDHCFGVDLYEDDARRAGTDAPRVVAHEAIRARFARYRETAGYNAVINQRQFRLARPYWPTHYREPDVTYRDRLSLEIGGEAFELVHARGETDDHTWLWIPERKVVCTGDLFIWASPNCGNPQKVQRYAIEWADALDEMSSLGATVLLPGHGLPIIGADRVRAALTDAAALLRYLHTETIRMMNEGARLDDIVHTVRAPAELIEKPYLKPVYDEPEFVVRNVWRLFGGWYDGNPANLKPASERAVALEVAALAGGADRLAARALELADGGDLRLAGHLVEMASLAAEGREASTAHAARAEVFRRRVDAEASLMAKGVFGWAVAESTAVVEGHETH
ncbi:MAG TPA: alkyl sulfatase dimerization domain-containing protein [Acidimicrobiia bacterium]|jgi:alkyl sulfatase BDS1-like metallo-beta-lactamase superfamily hydrolase